ncbi:hypothetical protein ACQPZ2_00665 [Nocardia pseudovaccinii]|uniref:hypothetical protein n=1 Tax=Nocardia pseudovaccinii TaxID=189540 RepID=UPI003D8B69CE
MFTAQVLVAAPAAAVALFTLWKTIPSTRRLHMHKAERLAKLVEAAGDDCPKILKVKLAQEVHWVAATYAIRLRGSDFRFAVYVTAGNIVFVIGWVLLISWLLDGSMALFFALGLLAGALSLVIDHPVERLRDWILVRRTLYALLGGRGDIPQIPRPSRLFGIGVPPLWDVDDWVLKVFGIEPHPSTIKANDMTALRAEIENWSRRRRWYTRWKN